jgi:RNA polymerase sigma factor (sigma-70 family)
MSNIQKLAEDFFIRKDGSAINGIYEYFSKKVEWQKSRTNDFSEVQSDINLAVTQAINTYDITKNVQFKTYVWTCFQNLVGTEKVRQNAKKKKTWDSQEITKISTSSKLSPESTTEVEDMIADNTKSQEIQSMIHQIDFYDFVEQITDKKDKAIIVGIFEGKKQYEIANQLGMTNANVTMRLRKIATKPYSNKLYELLKG